jgi:lysyl endopeptidase
VKNLNELSSYLTTFILLLIIGIETDGQISIGGTPKSISEKSLLKISELPFVTMPSFDFATVIKEDSIDQLVSKPFRFAKGFDVSLSINNSGKWEILDNGDRIWRLGIKSPGAYSINILFSEFDIPEGAEVFIFNSKLSHIIGAFTSQNRSESGILATAPVRSDIIVVEYYEPKNISKFAKLTIGSIGHAYKNVVQACVNPPQGGSCKGNSLSCEVDDTCSQGNDWHNEKHAVCRIFFRNSAGDYEMCTGALVNNTAHDGTPYFLTANHCVCNNSIANSVVVLFNYESPTCNGADGPLTQTLSGSTLRANWANSDFALLLLSSTPPSSYKPYYLGWDNTGNNPGTPVTVIHHPKGDVKKISISTNSVSRALVNYNDGSTCQPTGFNVDTWYESQWTTGATEPGSSGAPLFDLNKRIVGQDYAGPTIPFCNDFAFFGRFSVSWTGNGTHETQLSFWLDPCGLGVSTLDGNYFPSLSGPTPRVVCSSGASFTVNNVPIGSSVSWNCSTNITFDNQTGNPKVFTATGNGSGWVQATIDSSTCSSIRLPRYAVWVGTPIVNYIMDQNSNQIGVMFCPNVNYGFWPKNDILCTPTSYYWSISPTSGVNGFCNTCLNNWLSFSNTGVYYLSVNETNACGTGSPFTSYLVVTPCGYYRFSLSPNPASDNVKLTKTFVQDTTTLAKTTLSSFRESNSSDAIVYTVKIYNSSGTLFYSTKKSGDEFSIPVNYLKDGTYIVEVTDGKQSYRQQLIIKH